MIFYNYLLFLFITNRFFLRNIRGENFLNGSEAVWGVARPQAETVHA
jgi:hypothetical protein